MSKKTLACDTPVLIFTEAYLAKESQIEAYTLLQQIIGCMRKACEIPAVHKQRKTNLWEGDTFNQVEEGCGDDRER